MKKVEFDKQAYVNELGEKMVELFTQEYGYIDYDPELIPEEIEIGEVKLQLAVNGHEDCPRYNAQVMYVGGIEEYDIQIWVEYYRSSIFHTIQIMPMYEGKEYEFEPFDYELSKELIISTMNQLMLKELN